MKNVCVYCGSRTPKDPDLIQVANQLGEFLAQNKLGLVYGGGNVGVMGKIADTVIDRNGHVIGIIPTALKEREVLHLGISETYETPDMHTRKALMEQKSDAFVILPGGFGTLDEFFEILTWRQLGIHNKPIILLNVKGYFDGLVQFMETAIEQDFVRADNRSLFKITSTIEETESLLNELF